MFGLPPSIAARLDRQDQTNALILKRLNDMATGNEAVAALAKQISDNSSLLMRLAVLVQGTQAAQAAAIDAAVAAAVTPLQKALTDQAAVVQGMLAAAPNPAGTITTATPKA